MTTENPITVSMDELLEKSSPSVFNVEPGDIITGHVIGKQPGLILVDVGGISTGIISGKELNDMFNTAKNVKVGDEITAFVLEAENNDGTMMLSLRKAAQMKAWEYFEKIKESGGIIEVVAEEANKGGLMVNANGVRAFLPVSQLAPENYPRVNAANAEEILAKLKALIGKKFTCKIILLNNEETNKKLVVSERAARQNIRDDELAKLKVGDIVHGRVNGLVKFGTFLTFGNLEGLVHISELTWSRVNNPTELYKLNDEVQAKVIGIEGDKISLSIKALLPDPWKDKIKNFVVGSIHKGSINKVTNFGVFVTIAEDVNGLVHISEFQDETINPEEVYVKDEEVEVKIVKILEEDRSLGLSFKGVEGAKSGPKTKKKNDKKEETMESEGKEKKSSKKSSDTSEENKKKSEDKKSSTKEEK